MPSSRSIDCNAQLVMKISQPLVLAMSLSTLPALACTGMIGGSSDDADNEGIDDTGSLPIIGGSATNIEEVPWQIQLVKNGNPGCGGSILSETWIVTAAHCVYEELPSVFQVAAGIRSLTDIGVSGQLVDVAEVIVHPDFNGATTDGNDLALIELATPLNLSPAGVSTIAIASESDSVAGVDRVGTYGRLSGWGWAHWRQFQMNPYLKSVDIPIISNAEANAVLSQWDQQLLDSGLAGGYLNQSRAGTCFGDSGGPLVVQNADRTGSLLAGIVSWGPDCMEDANPQMFTRVASFHDWIRETMSCSAQDSGGWAYCSASCPCGAGKGDCDSDTECKAGLECVDNIGAIYGFASSVDICQPPEPNGSLGGWSFCSAETPCDLGGGDCDDDSDCLPGTICVDDVGSDYGFGATVDVCEREKGTSTLPGAWTFCSDDSPCGVGQGDCDNNDECVAGLSCSDDLGTLFGWSSAVDVCTCDGCDGRLPGDTWTDGSCSYECSESCTAVSSNCSD